MPNVIRIARGLGIAIIVVIYAVLVHHVNASDPSAVQFGIIQSSALGALLALTPIFLLVITYAWKAKSRLASISSLLIFSVTSWLLWSFVKHHIGLVFWMLDVGLMLALLMTFGQTLLSDRKPLCVHFAEIINGGSLPPEHENYARKVTVAWVVFFAMIILASTLLFFLAPLVIWSFFVNFLTLPLVALMFIGEFMLRRRLLSNLPTGHVLDAVRAYLNKSAHVP
ncbi:MAG: hypothetical protein V4552_03445 [Pseudomonadota bacterium]